ncbi:MAG: MlaD family protein [Bacteroidales bacterium]
MSKFKITREQKIGLFAIITLLSLYVVVNYLKGKNLFSSRNTYISIYHDVEGLTPTGPVYIGGLKVGTIETIYYDQVEKNFTVKLKIKSTYSIPSNSIAQVYSADIMGTKALRINMGDALLSLKNNDTLASATEKGLIDIITTEFLPLKEDISNLIANINVTFNNVNDLLNPQAKNDLAKSFENLNKTLASAKNISSSLEESAPQINDLMKDLKELSAKLNIGTESLNRGLENVVEITDSLKNSDLAGTITNLRDLLKKIQDPSGTIGKLLQTDTIHNSIERLISDLDELVNNINNNPKKYIKISIF